MKISCLCLALLFAVSTQAQTFNFSLTGNPVNTTGWTMSNHSYVENDYIVLTNNINDQVGYIYYSTPQNLANCSQFTVSFEFRITNSSSPTADGIAFFYISNPPSGFISGGGIGLPTNPNGLVTIMDTYDNDNTPDNPLVSLRRYDGTSSYVEGSSTGLLAPNATNQNFITDGNWHTCLITYSFGTISVSFDNNPPILTGTTTLNINGYFGLSASTGGKNAKHAIKNVQISGAAEPDPPLTDTVYYCQYETAAPLTAQGNNLLWYTSAQGGTPTTTAPTPSTSTPGTYTWYVSSEVPGCNIESQRAPLAVIVHPKPAPPTITVPTHCSGVPAPSLVVSSGQSIKWYDAPTGGTGSLNPPTVNTSAPGTFTYYASQTEISGCESDRVPVTIVVNQTPIVDFDYQIGYHCSGIDTIRFQNLTQFASDYLWNFTTGSSSTEMNPTRSFPAGTYQVILTANNNGCTSSAMKNITLGHALQASFATSSDTICANEQVIFTNTSTVEPVLNAGASYTWLLNDSAILSTNQHTSFTFTQPGIYKVSLIAKNAIPCSDTFSKFIVVDAYPEIGFSVSDSIICQGETVHFTLNGSHEAASTLYWNFGDSNDQFAGETSLSHSYENAGTFPAKIVVDYRACPTLTTVINIHVKESPKIELGRDTTLCLDGQPHLFQDRINQGNPEARWLWNTGDTTSYLLVRHEGTYSLRVTVGGCSNREDFTVKKDCYVNIPNSFTPNGDGENDYFLPRQVLSEGLTAFHMTIHNRWGQVVFETNSINGRGWDGKFNGTPQPMGVYIYQIRATFKNGREEQYTGNVTLIR